MLYTTSQAVSFLVQVALVNIHDAVKQSVCDLDLDAVVMGKIEDTFNPMGMHGKLFSGLETNYLQPQLF